MNTEPRKSHRCLALRLGYWLLEHILTTHATSVAPIKAHLEAILLMTPHGWHDQPCALLEQIVSIRSTSIVQPSQADGTLLQLLYAIYAETTDAIPGQMLQAIPSIREGLAQFRHKELAEGEVGLAVKARADQILNMFKATSLHNAHNIATDQVLIAALAVGRPIPTLVDGQMRHLYPETPNQFSISHCSQHAVLTVFEEVRLDAFDTAFQQEKVRLIAEIFGCEENWMHTFQKDFHLELAQQLATAFPGLK